RADEIAWLHAVFPGLVLAPGERVLAGDTAYRTIPALVAGARAARFRASRGSECREGTRVEAVDEEDGGFTLRLADGGALRARRVLACTGPWPGVGPGAAAASAAGVRVKKVAALHLQGPPPAGAPLLFFFDDDAFLVPAYERGEWIFSFTSREWDVEPGPGLAILPADREVALEVLRRRVPPLADGVIGGRVWCDAYTPGWDPLVTAAAPGFIVAGACSGSGYRLAPAVASDALDLLDEGSA
ncbi:MAG TPA: FAD-dependent oxidoreductase, partial [Longimicrobium sp.]|nr:FAD-dependent oxidoreductase [Longimicrobium sp.]